MAKPYSIEIVADTAKAVKGAGDLEDAVSDLADSLDQIEDATKDAATGSERNLDKIGDSLDDIEKSAKDAATGSERQLDKIGDSLDDVGDDAKKAGQKLEDEITDGAKDAVKSADKMESSFSEAFDGMRKRSRESADDINRNTQGMNEAQAEVLDEMTSNFGETMSSWNGSAEDAVRIIADTFGGLAGSMAIGGAAGSLILGSVAGLISVFVQKWEDGAEQIEERNQQMYQQMLENADAYFSQEQIVERFHQQMQGGDDAPVDKKTFQLLQSSTGMNDQELSLAIADPRGSQGQQIASGFQSQRTALDKRQPVSGDYPESSGQYEADLEGWRAEKDAINEAEGAWKDYRGGVDSTSDSIKSSNEFLEENGYLLSDNGGRARDLTTAQADSAQAFKDTKAALEDNIETYGGAKEAMTANRSELAGLVDTLASEQEALEASGASSEEVTALQKSQAEQFIETASAAGLERDEAINLAQQLGLIPPEVATEIKQKGAAEAQKGAKDTTAALSNVPKKTPTEIELKRPSNWAISSVLSGIEASLRPVRVQVQPVAGRTAYSAI